MHLQFQYYTLTIHTICINLHISTVKNVTNMFRSASPDYGCIRHPHVCYSAPFVGHSYIER